MEKEEKIKELLDAVKRGKVSKRQLDVKGKGKAILKLEQGLEVPEDKVSAMYDILTALSDPGKSQGISTKKGLKKTLNQLGKIREKLGNKLGKELEKPIREKLGNKLENQLGKIRDEQLEKIRENYNAILTRLDSITLSLSTLSDEQREIKDKLEEIRWVLNKSRQGETLSTEKEKEETPNILGFTLVQKKKEGSKYWYAAKTKEGKTKWIYIGKEKGKAEEKIKAWLDKEKQIV